MIWSWSHGQSVTEAVLEHNALLLCPVSFPLRSFNLQILLDLHSKEM